MAQQRILLVANSADSSMRRRVLLVIHHAALKKIQNNFHATCVQRANILCTCTGGTVIRLSLRLGVSANRYYSCLAYQSTKKKKRC